MKVITEAALRLELKCEEPEVYVIPEGSLLSPAAREYLSQRKIKIRKAVRFLSILSIPLAMNYG